MNRPAAAVVAGIGSYIYADGYRGNGQTAGDAFGGQIDIYADDGLVDLGGAFQVGARGFGGWATFGIGGDGGDGTGGRASLDARANNAFEQFTSGTISAATASSRATRSAESAVPAIRLQRAARAATAMAAPSANCNFFGSASITAEVRRAVLDFGNVTVSLNGTGGAGGAASGGGAGGAGGSGYGGNACVRSVNQQELFVTEEDSITFGNLRSRPRASAAPAATAWWRRRERRLWPRRNERGQPGR